MRGVGGKREGEGRSKGGIRGRNRMEKEGKRGREGREGRREGREGKE